MLTCADPVPSAGNASVRSPSRSATDSARSVARPTHDVPLHALTA